MARQMQALNQSKLRMSPSPEDSTDSIVSLLEGYYFGARVVAVAVAVAVANASAIAFGSTNYGSAVQTLSVLFKDFTLID